MSMTKLLLVVCIVVGASAAVSIGEERPANKSCAEAMTTAEMQECVNTHYKKVDGELDRVYQTIISRLDKTRRTKLREAQRAWILFRDKSAAFEASEVEGGTMYPLVYQSVLASMTEKRIDELKNILDILQRIDSQ